MTPQELEQQRQREAQKRAAEKRKLALQGALAVGAVAVTAAASLAPLDRINQSINTKIEGLKSKYTSLISAIVK